MQTHGHTDADELSANGPNFLAVCFNEGEVMGANEQALDKFETVGLVLGSVTIEGRAHDVVEFAANVLEGVTQLGHEAVAWWEVVYCDGHDHADGGEDDTVRTRAGFIAGPSAEKDGSIYVTINPIAVFKVVRDKAVYCVEGGQESEKVSVVFVCRHDVVEVGVIAGLAVAIVRLPRVLEGVSGEEGRGKGKYQSEMSDGRSGAGVEATVAMAAKQAGSVVSFEDIGLYGFLLWGGGCCGKFEGVFEMGGEGRARTVVCKDVRFEEGDRVFETGDFLHGVDPAGITVLRG